MALVMEPCSADYKVVNLHARPGDYSALKNEFCSLFKTFSLDICKHILDYFSSIDENRKILKRIEHLLLYVDFLYLDAFNCYKVVDTETCIFYAYNTYLIRINPEELLYFKNVLKSPDKVQLYNLLEAYIIAVYALEYMLGIYKHMNELHRCLIPHYEEKALGVNVKNEEDYFMYEIDKYRYTSYVYERATRAVSYVRKLGIEEAYSKITHDTSRQKYKVKSLYDQIQLIIGKYGYNWEPMQHYTNV